jgi:hypothetical protein
MMSELNKSRFYFGGSLAVLLGSILFCFWMDALHNKQFKPCEAIALATPGDMMGMKIIVTGKCVAGEAVTFSKSIAGLGECTFDERGNEILGYAWQIEKARSENQLIVTLATKQIDDADNVIECDYDGKHGCRPFGTTFKTAPQNGTPIGMLNDDAECGTVGSPWIGMTYPHGCYPLGMANADQVPTSGPTSARIISIGPTKEGVLCDSDSQLYFWGNCQDAIQFKLHTLAECSNQDTKFWKEHECAAREEAFHKFVEEREKRHATH